MRFFFLLLFATNLAFISWQIFAPADEQTVPPPYGNVKIESKGLRLLSELSEKDYPPTRKMVAIKEEEPEPTIELIAPEPQPVIAEEKEEEAPTVTVAKSCYQSSPFITKKEVESFEQELEKAGISYHSLQTIQVQKQNYWVMLKPYKSREKANEASDILKKKRVKDFFIVRSGEYENALSLGVYSSQERAEQRRKEIIDLKIRLRKPVIELLDLPAKRFVVSLQHDKESLPGVLLPLLESTEHVFLKKIVCK